MWPLNNDTHTHTHTTFGSEGILSERFYCNREAKGPPIKIGEVQRKVDFSEKSILL